MQQLITAGTVLPGPAGQELTDGAVLIDGGTITAVGSRRDIEAQARSDARRRDYPAATLLPGLINCHVHLAFDAVAPIDNLLGADDSDLLLGMAGRAQQALAGGVTTLRDLGDRNGLAIRLRDAIARGEMHAPRILSSGPPLTIPKGHCWFFGGEVADDQQTREMVRRNAELGADVIKVMASGGQLTPSSPPMWQNQFSLDQLQVIVDEATKAGLPVAAHAHGTDAIAAAVTAGASTIEHCTWMGNGGGSDQRDDVARDMAARGIYACVALGPHWPEFFDRIGAERAEQILKRFWWLDDLGVPMITGTDAGLANSTFHNYADALELYEHAGFSPAHVLELATVSSAAGLGLAGTTGQLAPGYSADLLVVDDNPLEGLAALRHPRLVLARGHAADRALIPARS